MLRLMSRTLVPRAIAGGRKSFAGNAGDSTFGREVVAVDKVQHSVKDDATKEALSSLYGTPVRDFKRIAYISVPARSTMQSGKDMHRQWTITFPNEKTNQWKNPLMGWTSCDDGMKQVTLKFPNKLAAVNFCENSGYDYVIEGERLEPKDPKSYADNFKYRPPPAMDVSLD